MDHIHRLVVLDGNSSGIGFGSLFEIHLVLSNGRLRSWFSLLGRLWKFGKFDFLRDWTSLGGHPWKFVEKLDFQRIVFGFDDVLMGKVHPGVDPNRCPSVLVCSD